MGWYRVACALALASAAWLLVTSTANAQEGERGKYYERKEEGWFWRERLPTPPELLSPLALDEVVPEMSAPDPISPATSMALPEVRPLSPAWLREKLPEYRDRALENPSPENVRAYYYLQRYAMDVAERFALVAQKVVLADPALDENTRRPISTYGAQVFDEVARENITRVASKIASMAGVWYFYRSDCPYCRAQNPVLERLQRRIGLAVLPIALDGQAMPEGAFSQFVSDRGHAEQLGVTQTPTLYLVRKPDEFVLLSEGLVTDDGLLERIVYAAHDAGWITDEEFNSTRAAKPAEPAVNTLEVSAETLNDPVTLVELLRSRTFP